MSFDTGDANLFSGCVELSKFLCCIAASKRGNECCQAACGRGQARFSVPGTADEWLVVHDASGRAVARLALERGVGTWDGTGPDGRSAGAGVFFAGTASGATTRIVRLAGQ